VRGGGAAFERNSMDQISAAQDRIVRRRRHLHLTASSLSHVPRGGLTFARHVSPFNNIVVLVRCRRRRRRYIDNVTI